jgi:O-methyltransferase
MFNRAIRSAKRLSRWRLQMVQRDYHANHAGIAYAYQSVIRNQAYAPWITDPDFRAVHEVARLHTLVDVARCYELWDMVHNLRSVQGAVVEVGVWRGGTGAILARALERTKPQATIYLCDTFRGVVKANSYDAVYRGGEHADTSLEHVDCLLRSLSIQNAALLEGSFPEDTGERIPAGPVALCHIDVDVYQSARDTVEWVEPRLAKGGAIVFDDYGFPACAGVTRLVHELKSTGLWTSIYNLNGHAILFKR